MPSAKYYAKYAKMESYREKSRINQAKRRQTHREECLEYNRQYSKTAAGKKSNTISDWKRKRGVISDDYSSLYDEYLKAENCEECGIAFGKKGDGTNTFKCLDHCHKTGKFRNFLCNKCNIERGK